MACYHPIAASQNKPGGPIKIGSPALGEYPLRLPCGTCLGCKADKATEWARRCTHESKTWDKSIFLTLTYDDEHLPAKGHLLPEHLTKFWKRLRKNAHGDRRDPYRTVRLTKRGKESKRQHRPIRYFACGEYGEDNGRPHYHAAIFNLAVPDAEYGGTKDGRDWWQSKLLADTWGQGRIEFGEFTPDAAAYIAQYQLKKQKYDPAYDEPDEDGVLKQRPFLRMSQGIARDWVDTYWQDLKPGYLTVDGFKAAIPRYYRERIKRLNPREWEQILARQEQHRLAHPSDRNEPERLQAQEVIHIQKKQYSDARSLT